jgi:predicted transcriptional regulator
MPVYRNITLSLPVKVLRQIKRIAARRQTSVSRLLTQALEEMAAREDEYAQARRRHLAWLEHGAELGTDGRIRWSRESLHDR